MASITGFSTHRVPVEDDVSLNVAVGGDGPPVVLLHGFPQTHLMWRHVASALAEDHTVICPDLRGYGDSDKPVRRPDEANTAAYSKRRMADDVVRVAAALGHERFALVGHDRGALVAFRAGLDHPEAVSHLACLDVLPTIDMWDSLHGVSAAVGFHLYLMAQPPGIAEALISAAPEAFFAHFLDLWGEDRSAIPEEVRREYLRAGSGAVDSIVADYRASAGIDLEHDRADAESGARLRMPVTVVQQDWGAALGYDATALWRRWAADLEHRTTGSGHFMAEEAPDEIESVIRDLLRRAPRPEPVP